MNDLSPSDIRLVRQSLKQSLPRQKDIAKYLRLNKLMVAGQKHSLSPEIQKFVKSEVKRVEAIKDLLSRLKLPSSKK